MYVDEPITTLPHQTTCSLCTTRAYHRGRVLCVVFWREVLRHHVMRHVASWECISTNCTLSVGAACNHRQHLLEIALVLELHASFLQKARCWCMYGYIANSTFTQQYCECVHKHAHFHKKQSWLQAGKFRVQGQHAKRLCLWRHTCNTAGACTDAVICIVKWLGLELLLLRCWW